MKIDESVIAKVLDNKASPEEARKVAGWFATEEGNKYLSERFDWEIGMLSEEMPESIDPHSIPEVKMKVRFMNESQMDVGGGCAVTVCFFKCFLVFFGKPDGHFL